ncbi:hypothetical protein niasHT_024651 [Heterodera trifolii]|uniref:NADH dehydrogenase subunit 6 n=1 Tax=Heterodera trifolii TaxID=157864 RepID=A0ABD2K7P0_9BILA
MFNSNNNPVKMNSAQKMPSASAAPRRQHPHFCLFGTVHLATAMKLIIIVGLLAIAALCTAEAIHLRRALTVIILPIAVSLITIAALCRSEPCLLWPIIGISFFHIFLDGYLCILFLFIFFFKPIYLLMVFNWAFDTLHTTKTLSFYIYCAIISMILLVFFLYNLWQLRTALRFQTFLEERHN